MLQFEVLTLGQKKRGKKGDKPHQIMRTLQKKSETWTSSSRGTSISVIITLIQADN
jgi:hypothetical protein